MDPDVHILRTSSVTGFDPITSFPSRAVQVTYMIGDQGPFTLVTPEKEFDENYVIAETTKRANQLRALGLIKK